MKPTAIQQIVAMVEDLKAQNQWGQSGILLQFVLDEARRLAEIEAKEKPQSDAGLVERLELLIKVYQKSPTHEGFFIEAQEVLSEYHPAHSATDKGFWVENDSYCAKCVRSRR